MPPAPADGSPERPARACGRGRKSCVRMVIGLISTVMCTGYSKLSSPLNKLVPPAVDSSSTRDSKEVVPENHDMTSNGRLQQDAAATARAQASPETSMLHGPLLPVLTRLALPTVAVMFLVTLLSVAETYFVSSLGTDAIAAASLVVPVVLLMTMVSNGGIGGGVSSAIARARGAGRLHDAESLAWHAMVIAAVFGALFTLGLHFGGPALYRWLGGEGTSLQLAIQYSDILFGGAVASWMLMLMQSALRGAGNVKVPAMIVAGSVALGIAISPALIMGCMGLPQLGVAGAGIAQVLTNLAALAAVVAYMRSPRSSLRLRRHPLRRIHFQAILGIGLMSSLNAVLTNLTLT
ncbi:MAG TPA: MATE family efflux transporter, partial [Ramlibacter sp.]|nr:MATE family efflux transporter [Ramlibacter sp.]